MNFRNILNYSLFLLNWFAAVLGAAYINAWFGLVTGAILLVCHLLFIARHNELKLILLATLLGFTLDSLNSFLGIIQYQVANPWAPLAPPFILGLWLGFATILCHSFAWFQEYLLLSGIAALLTAPWTYAIGISLHVLSFENYWLSIITIGVEWFFLLPCLLFLAKSSTKS